MSVVTLQESRSSGERYRAAFDARWPANDPPDDPLVELRRAALERFVTAGFPTQRQEDWKYTNLRRLEARTFAPAKAGALEVGEQRWIDNAGARIVLVNGHWMPALSTVGAQPPGVTLLTLKQWSEHDPAAVAAFLAQASRTQPGALEDLNPAFFEDGVVVGSRRRHDSRSADLHRASMERRGDAVMSHPRVVVRAGRNSRCTLIEHFLGATAGECFTNAVCDIELAAGASVEHYRIQQESARSFHIGHVNVRLQQDSRYASHDIALGASLARLNLATTLQRARRARRAARSVRAARHPAPRRAHAHRSRRPAHDQRRGLSRHRRRRGRGVFNGKVIVRPGAQKIDARQSSRNLLLSPQAPRSTPSRSWRSTPTT